MIELFIENKKIDITNDLEINFTYESIDPDKLSSIKNSFSKTVNIPGTPNNNITFGHIFRFDKYIPHSGPSNINSYYDPHKRVEWFINKNGSLINRGYCTLDNIIVKNERDITYQFTLYGGIGEFFYSLSYNSDGSHKTLKDLYWNWYPKFGRNGYSSQTLPSDENTKVLYKCSSDIVVESYHKLNPLYTYSGTTYIDRDIVFVPSYTGLYEDFDSKHMLVNTYNNTMTATPSVISDNTKDILQESFPDSITDSDGTYTTIGRNFSSADAYKYGIVSFSRDIDPWEAGDIRISELPVAVRLSKLMNVISQSINNGGYEVIWDSDILNSYNWLYSWILLGKLKQDRNELSLFILSKSPTYDGQSTKIKIHNNTGIAELTENTTNYLIPSNTNSVEKDRYKLNININPSFTINTNSNNFQRLLSNYDDLISGCSMEYYSTSKYIWNTSVLIHKIYSGNNVIKTIADIFYFSTNPQQYSFGYTKSQSPDVLRLIKNNLEGKIRLRLNNGGYIDQFVYHNCKLDTPEINNNNIVYKCSDEIISTTLNINESTQDFKIEQIQGVFYTSFEIPSGTISVIIDSGLYGVDNITYYTSEYPPILDVPVSREGFYGFITGDYNTLTLVDYNNYTVGLSFNLNENKQNGLITTKSSGFNIIELTKDLLFDDSQSPMKYLADYCKLMNYKFICDDTNKKIYIKTLKNYYLGDNIINLDSRIDIGRDINIKNITTDYKIINIGLDTPETYPVYIFNKTSKDKFNNYIYDTGIKYNLPETSLLNDLCYKNVIDYQQSSIYYNIYPQIPRPYATQSISWTLFKKDNNNFDNINKKEFFTYGVPSTSLTLLNKYDFLPKISLFDKDNKSVDFKNSLIYLNGFVRNFDYNEINITYPMVISPDSIIESKYINTDGVELPTNYQDIYIYEVNPNSQYYITASYNSNYSSYTVNYYNSSDIRIGTEYLQASSNLSNAILTIPSGTRTIKCNFRKADTNAKLKILGPTYIISPRINFTNDSIEQYYLNQSRCYLYDFDYTAEFTSWGYYNVRKSSSTSWVLPYFSRDLYNIYVPDVDSWNLSAYKLTSWNIVNQNNLDNLYNLYDTDFIYRPDYNYLKYIHSNSYTANEYTIDNINTLDDTDLTERIYNTNWKNYLDDLYDRNTRDITVYIDLSGLGDANSIMRNVYSWKSYLWIITKIENFRISETTDNKFVKVRMHKIKNLDTWTN